jgi:hypothetical protein
MACHATEDRSPIGDDKNGGKGHVIIEGFVTRCDETGWL